MGTFCTSADFNYDNVLLSYYGTSFDPEKRAKNEIDGHVNWLNSEAERLESMCTNDIQRAWLADQLVTFKACYLSHAERITAARSNCISTMIAGPSNFPVRRAEKANATLRRRYEEYEKWEEKAFRYIEKGIAARKSTEEVEQEKMVSIKRMIQDSFDRGLFKANLYGRLATFAKNNSELLVQEALSYLKELQDKHHGGMGFTARHKVWQLKGTAPQETARESTRKTINGIEIIRNAEIDRVQIFFDGKPDEGVRRALKSSGWRWSPRTGAWQRKNTDNAYFSAKNIAAQ